MKPLIFCAISMFVAVTLETVDRAVMAERAEGTKDSIVELDPGLVDIG